MLANHDAQATVAVKNLDKARPFYEGVLGLEPVGGDEPTVQGYKAAGSVLLVYQSAFAGTNKATSVTWPLGDDFDASIQALRAKGLTFEVYDMPGAKVEDGVHIFGDMKVVWFKDPDGNILSVGNYKA
jgi:catechol 2,3-dioxygenase-like lactoylglutathione lyase family enzyme